VRCVCSNSQASTVMSHPSRNEYEPIANIPVVKCATVYTSCDSAGATVLLVEIRSVWFGDQMPNSLFNTHQLQA
jgi:hypothetical protein